MGADDVGADDGVVFVGDDFDKAGGLAVGECHAAGGHGEAGGFDVLVFFAGVGFGEADGGDLRVGVNGGGDDGVVFGVWGAGDVVGGDGGLAGSDVGELQFAGDVADGVDVGYAGAAVVVDFDEAVFEGDSGFFEAEVGG